MKQDSAAHLRIENKTLRNRGMLLAEHGRRMIVVLQELRKIIGEVRAENEALKEENRALKAVAGATDDEIDDLFDTSEWPPERKRESVHNAIADARPDWVNPAEENDE
jgi:cell division protein FtsB